MSTVIVGAGIMGCATAFYLSQSPEPGEIHLVESSPELFAGASGNAAGFLARDWFSPALSKLGELSFDLHQQLAEENDGSKTWGWSRSTGTSLAETVGSAKKGTDWLMEGVSRSTAAAKSTPDNPHFPPWLKDRGDLDVLSDGDSTAQVVPKNLCHFLFHRSKSRGIHVHRPYRPTSVARDPSGALTSITLTLNTTKIHSEKTVPCNRLVLAAGPWTQQVFTTLFPNAHVQIPISSLAGHSLVLQTPHWPPPPLDSTDPANTGAGAAAQDCHAVFTTEAEADYSPELFSRLPDGHIYLAGLNSSTYPLPEVANESVIDRESIAVLHKTAKRLLGDDVQVLKMSVCWRPVTRSGVPVIADLKSWGEEGVVVCAGHGPWGISLSLGSGYCVAKMLQGEDMRQYVARLGL